MSFQNNDDSPKRLRMKQLSLLGGGVVITLFSVMYFLLSNASQGEEGKSSQKAVEKKVADLATPLSGVDDREIWVSRVEKKTQEVREESDRLRQENQFLQKRVDVLEEIFKKVPSGKVFEASKDLPSSAHSSEQPSFPEPFLTQPKPFPPSGHFDEEIRDNKRSYQTSQEMVSRKKGSKIAHLGGGDGSPIFKGSDIYLPSGTYCKAIIDMGVAASTATNAQGNPEPVKLRLVDDGNLPGGLKGVVRDAVLIGACYGDISSERARCRLETLSWRDKRGVQIEKKVEGWVVGEDGLAGLRGKVVDRSGEIVRESFGAGLLSAASRFLQFEAQSSVYPTTPFGQSRAMSPKNALQGAASSGAGNALDKLADFSIKRAEQMQPVILISSGRVVDVLFKTGVDLTPDRSPEMKVVGSKSSNVEGEDH